MYVWPLLLYIGPYILGPIIYYRRRDPYLAALVRDAALLNKSRKI